MKPILGTLIATQPDQFNVRDVIFFRSEDEYGIYYEPHTIIEYVNKTTIARWHKPYLQQRTTPYVKLLPVDNGTDRSFKVEINKLLCLMVIDDDTNTKYLVDAKDYNNIIIEHKSLDLPARVFYTPYTKDEKRYADLGDYNHLVEKIIKK